MLDVLHCDTYKQTQAPLYHRPSGGPSYCLVRKKTTITYHSVTHCIPHYILFLAVLGCLLVASPSFTNASASKSDSLYLQLLGYAAVLSEVVMSGFASIYFEKVIFIAKTTTPPPSLYFYYNNNNNNNNNFVSSSLISPIDRICRL